MIARKQIFGRAASTVLMLLATLMLVSVAPTNAAPYPPIPPTGGLSTPAAARVPAPAQAVGAIAPGSFPVQARTGAADVPGSAGVSSAMILVAVVATIGVALTGAVAVNWSRRRREPTTT